MQKIASLADAAAQLMQLGEAETLGLSDHHDARLGHVDPDFDDRGRDQEFQRAGGEILHHPVFFRRLHATVDETGDGAEAGGEMGETFLRRRGVGRFRFQTRGQTHRTWGTRSIACATAFDHFVEARERDDAGIDLLPPGGFFGQARDIHVAEGGQGQGARWASRS